MCGITGIIAFKNTVPTPTISKMTDALAHRGPDACGYYESPKIQLGHRRLSIIDLSEKSNQPLYSTDKKHSIVFNGEIYNYAEVKKELTQYAFETDGDGEVVLAAYLTWGPSSLAKFKGMFAFAIVDIEKQELFIARDRLGVKPIYYYASEEYFIFASELRAMLASDLVPKKLDNYAIQCYLQMQSFFAPHTIVKNVQQMACGTYAIINKNGVQFTKYWEITKPQEKYSFSTYDDVKRQVKQLMQQSIERRLVADVPVAAFLSGGIDSSAVVGLMAQLKSGVETFNIAFQEKEFDESQYARMVAEKFNTKHHEIILKPTDFLDALPTALAAMDIPSADGVNSYVVSKKVKEQGIKVALTGAGGDELFAGYQGFQFWHKANTKKWVWSLPQALRKLAVAPLPNSRKYSRIKQLVAQPDLEIESFQQLVREIIPQKEIAALMKVEKAYAFEKLDCSSFPFLSQYSIAELMGYTQYTLLKDTDQFSMAVALEVREPFFDSDLIEYVLQIPDQFKYPTYPKKLLVESLGDLLPPEIVHRQKKGFTFPWESWMKNELRSFCETNIKSLSTREGFNKTTVLKLWNDFLASRNVRWAEVWTLVVLENWLQNNGFKS